MKTNRDKYWPDVLPIGKTGNVPEIIVYNLSLQKRFFVDVTLKSSVAHCRLMTFDYFTFSSSKRHPNSYLVAQKVAIAIIAIFWGRNGHLRNFFFVFVFLAQNMTLCNFVTFEF